MVQNKTVTYPGPEESVSYAVVRGIADLNGIDPADLDERLYDYVDGDALDRLFHTRAGGPPSSDVSVSFDVAGCHVTVDGTGKVVVTRNSQSDFVHEKVF